MSLPLNRLTLTVLIGVILTAATAAFLVHVYVTKSRHVEQKEIITQRNYTKNSNQTPGGATTDATLPSVVCSVYPLDEDLFLPCLPEQWGIMRIPLSHGFRYAFARNSSLPLSEQYVPPTARVQIHAFDKGQSVSASVRITELISGDGTVLALTGSGVETVLEPGFYTFHVSRPGLAASLGPLELGVGRYSVEAHLHPVVKLRGLVRDALTDKPIPKAKIRISQQYPDFAVRQVFSDSRGKFLLNAIRPGRWRISVEADGYVPLLNVSYWISENPSLALLELHRGHTVEGMVKDARGVPVPSATVSIYGVAEDTSIVSPTTGSWQTVTSRDGTFRLTGVPTGQAVLRARTSRGEYGALDLGWISSDRRDLKVLLSDAGEVHGLIRDNRDLPVEAAIRVTSPDDPLFVAHAFSRQDGYFRIYGTPEHLNIEITAPGYTPLTKSIRSAKNDYRFVLNPASSELTIRFLDSNGLPVRGTVHLQHRHPWISLSGKTDPSGTVSFRRVPDVSFEYTFDASGFPRLKNTVGPGTHTVTVPFGSRINGFVRDIQTKEGLDATVYLEDALGMRHTARTTHGELLTAPLPPGKTRLALVADGHAPLFAKITVPEGRYPGSQAPDDHLWEMNPGVRITGEVLTSRGVHVRGALVGWQWGSAKTSGNGTFSLAWLPAGKVTLWAWHPSLGWSVQEVEIPQYTDTFQVTLILAGKSDHKLPSAAAISGKTILRAGYVPSSLGISLSLIMKSRGAIPLMMDDLIPQYMLISGSSYRLSKK